LPLGYIGSPSLPVSSALAVGAEALLLLAEVLLVLNEDHGGCVGRKSVGEKLCTKNGRVALQGASGGVGVDSQGMGKRCSGQTAKNDSVGRKCR
jgi:hypothetical protein